MKAIFLSALSALLAVSVFNPHQTAGAQNRLNEMYADESHCLITPEIRSDKDDSISCVCRDAIVDARYVHSTYVESGKDLNLTGTVLVLVANISQVCSENAMSYDGWTPVRAQNWKWDGPEVVRTYPPDSEIERIPPDIHGIRRVRYKVRLTFRDQQGEVSRVENFTAVDLLPAHWKPLRGAQPKN